MDYGKAFTYVFEDEKWILKILIGGIFFLLSFLILPLFLVLGYWAETLDRSAKDIKPILPEWDDLGGKLAKGFFVFFIYFLYQLPVTALLVIYFAVSVGLSSIPNQSQAVSALIGIFGFLVFLVVTAYSIALVLFLPVATMRYAVSNELPQAFKFKEIWAFIKDNIANLLIVILLSYLASIIGGFGFVALFIGAAFTYFYALLVTGNLYGQLYRIGAGQLIEETKEEVA